MEETCYFVVLFIHFISHIQLALACYWRLLSLGNQVFNYYNNIHTHVLLANQHLKGASYSYVRKFNNRFNIVLILLVCTENYHYYLQAMDITYT